MRWCTCRSITFRPAHVMWHVTTAAVFVLTLFYVPGSGETVIGELYLTFEYYNPNGALVDGNKCDFLEVCDIYFFVCVRSIGSTFCDIFNNTTRIYSDVTELTPAKMNETLITLKSPLGKKVEIGIDIWDFDSFDSSELVARFEGTIETKSLSMKWSQMSLTRADLVYQNNIYFKAFVRLECPSGSCNVVCIPRKGINTCDDEDNMVCERGLTGATCSEVDYCVEHNCAEYATCQSLPNGYKCVCGTYEGRACEKGYDPCQPTSPCGSHGQCRASGPHYQCVCGTGWGGNHCERPATACENAAQLLSPQAVCLNGGSCVDLPNGSTYHCMCLQPWSGPRCEVIDTCSEKNCSGHGVCIFPSTSNESFHCSCNSGWLGDSCSYRTQSPCYKASLKLHTNVSMVCLNGGVCIDNPNGVDLTCACKFGWLGPQCQTFFTETLYFILPMAMGPCVFLTLLAFYIRILRRRRLRRRTEPLTYAAIPVIERTNRDPIDSKILPYAVYTASDWRNTKPVGREEPKVFCKSTLPTDSDWKIEEDIGPALPPREYPPKAPTSVQHPLDQSF